LCVLEFCISQSVLCFPGLDPLCVLCFGPFLDQSAAVGAVPCADLRSDLRFLFNVFSSRAREQEPFLCCISASYLFSRADRFLPPLKSSWVAAS
jgi:hypothetical protein